MYFTSLISVGLRQNFEFFLLHVNVLSDRTDKEVHYELHFLCVSGFGFVCDGPSSKG